MDLSFSRTSNPHLLVGLIHDRDTLQRQSTCSCGWASSPASAVTTVADEWEAHVWRVIRSGQEPIEVAVLPSLRISGAINGRAARPKLGGASTVSRWSIRDAAECAVQATSATVARNTHKACVPATPRIVSRGMCYRDEA